MFLRSWYNSTSGIDLPLSTNGVTNLTARVGPVGGEALEVAILEWVWRHAKGAVSVCGPVVRSLELGVGHRGAGGCVGDGVACTATCAVVQRG